MAANISGRPPARRRTAHEAFGEGGRVAKVAKTVLDIEYFPIELILEISKYTKDAVIGLIGPNCRDAFEIHCYDKIRKDSGVRGVLGEEELRPIVKREGLSLNQFNPEIDSFTKLSKEIKTLNLFRLVQKISHYFKIDIMERLQEGQDPLTFMRACLNLNKEALKEIRFLDLSGLNITAIPKEILLLENLQELDLRNNKIKVIPAWIENLTHLEEIDLSNNQITLIFPQIQNLSDLKSLNLKNNQLTTLPDSIRNLENLELLFLSHNQFENFPAAISNLGNLKMLSVSHNRLTQLPENVVFRGLERLHLSNNQIAHLPDWIGAQASLERLTLSFNVLQMLPLNLNNLRRLRYIGFSDNPDLDYQGLRANFARHPVILRQLDRPRGGFQRQDAMVGLLFD